MKLPLVSPLVSPLVNRGLDAVIVKPPLLRKLWTLQYLWPMNYIAIPKLRNDKNPRNDLYLEGCRIESI